MARELILRLTAKDFEWQYFRGPGKGGQKRNKTSNACRCTHRGSGGVGVATEERSQRQNRKQAFLRCVGSSKFEAWHRIEVARRTGELALLEAEVEKSLRRIRVEVKDENGRWIRE